MVNEQIMAGTSATATAGAFVSSANEWLQFAALIVAIISGGLAIYTHIKRRKHFNESKTRKDD